MSDDLKVRGIVELILKGSGGKQARQQLDDVAESGTRAKRSLSGLDSVATKAAGAIGGLFALEKLRQIAVTSLRDFAAYERQLGGIATQLEQVGLDAESAMPRVRDFLEELEGLTGIARQDAAKPLQQFIALTGDLEVAMLAVRTAAGAGESGMVEFSNTANALASLLQGETAEAAKTLGVAVTDAAGRTKTAGEVWLEATDRFGEMAGTADDTEAALGRFGARWNAIKQGIGEFLSVGAKALDAFWIQQRIRVRTLIASMDDLGDVFRAFGTIDLGKLLRGDFSGATQGLRDAIAKAKEGITQDWAQIQWEEFGGDAGEALSKGLEEARAKGAEQADRREQANADAKAERDAQREAERLAREQQRLADESARRAAFELSADEALIRQKLQLAEEGTRERLNLELKALDLAKQRAIAQAEELGASTKAIRDAFRLAEEAAVDDFWERQHEKLEDATKRATAILLESYEEDLQAQLEAAEEGSQEKLDAQLKLLEAQRDQELAAVESTSAEAAAIRIKYEKKIERATAENAKARIAIARLEASQKRELALSIAADVVGSLDTIFGENKAFAIAQAIISTLVAVNRALEIYGPTPWGYAAAAAAALKGFATVRQIQSTQKGGGATSAAGGAGGGVAVSGAQAAAALPSGSQGSAAPVAAQPASPATSSGQASPQAAQEVHYHVHGEVVDGRALKRFMRRARQAEREDRARAVR